MASSRIKVKKGLDLPITGAPEQTIEEGAAVTQVAVIGSDYNGMRPTMASRGRRCGTGTGAFENEDAGCSHTSPGSGKVVAVNRGAKRALQSVVIALSGDAEERFEQFSDTAPDQLSREQVRDKLVASGLWTALRTRPFSKVPSPESTPHSLFVTAIDTNPLSADPQVVLAEHEADFTLGVQLLSKLSEGPTYLCKAPGASINGGGGQEVEFAGPHPAGLPGTHIHFVDPVGTNKTVWNINYQDVIAVGKLFSTHRLSVERTIALAGPQVERPRLIRTRVGAQLSELTGGQLRAARIASFLGRFIRPCRCRSIRLSRLSPASLGGRGTRARVFRMAKPGVDKFSSRCLRF